MAEKKDKSTSNSIYKVPDSLDRKQTMPMAHSETEIRKLQQAKKDRMMRFLYPFVLFPLLPASEFILVVFISLLFVIIIALAIERNLETIGFASVSYTPENFFLTPFLPSFLPSNNYNYNYDYDYQPDSCFPPSF